MKKKQIDHLSKIMSTSHGVFTGNFTIFQMQENWKRVGIRI